MTSAVTWPEDVVNLALMRIGYEFRVNNLFEGTKHATVALNIYAQTRDEMLRGFDWSFAERNVAMTLLKQAPAGGYFPPNMWSPAYPPVPWLYEVTYPVDALKIRAVKNVPIFLPDFDPQPWQFSVDNDNALAEPSKVVLCTSIRGRSPTHLIGSRTSQRLLRHPWGVGSHPSWSVSRARRWMRGTSSSPWPWPRIRGAKHGQHTKRHSRTGFRRDRVRV
jgi:hypothetical protein